jgi:hypothetical protein
VGFGKLRALTRPRRTRPATANSSLTIRAMGPGWRAGMTRVSSAANINWLAIRLRRISRPSFWSTKSSSLPRRIRSMAVPPMLIGPSLAPQDLLPIRQRYLDWATLLKRVYKVDILECPRCHGRLTLLAAISDPPVVKRILEHLQLPSEPPRPAPARPPPQTEMGY